jgi:alpha-N-acetylglucosaminidase
MIRFASLVLLFACTATAFAQRHADLEAARDLVYRVTGSKSFEVEIIAPDNGRDVFEIESTRDGIVLRGNNGVSVASALNWYLKYFCKCHYSLKGRQMELPEPLPSVSPKVRRVSHDQHRYFLNYCCFGYSLPWYDWPEWERLIDWMALNGVNLPLAITGQEAVWENTGKRLGFSKKEISSFLAGPPYMPFGWMGCLDGWGGPLPKKWIAQHQKLQQRILKRERELGMRPVLQGFTGHVPPATGARFPHANLHQITWLEDWQTTFLDPLEPLFQRFGKVFLEEQKKLFGSDHFYAADTFIEMVPPSGETNFLAQTGRAIFEGMSRADPKAVWVLQGWAFHYQSKFWTQSRIEAFLGDVPDSQMLVLDLFCDVTPVWTRTRAFCGKPWVWCALQNFGDGVYLGGNLARIDNDLSAARRVPLANKRVGIGFANEGLDYNPVVFDYLFEQAWRTEFVAMDQWLRQFAARSHGTKSPHSQSAWEILGRTVFNQRPQFLPGYLAAPTLTRPGPLPYSNKDLVAAWEHLLKAAPLARKSDAYRYDLVQVTRQVLGNHFRTLQTRAADAWQRKDHAGFKSITKEMEALISDVDLVLATRREFLLGTWLESARKWGRTKAEKDHMEWNARRVISMWGHEPGIRDYSAREWAGMLNGFYLKRWQKFLAAAEAALAARKDFDETQFNKDLCAWERAWAAQQEDYPTQPVGDSIETSERLWEKYHKNLAIP